MVPQSSQHRDAHRMEGNLRPRRSRGRPRAWSTGATRRGVNYASRLWKARLEDDCIWVAIRAVTACRTSMPATTRTRRKGVLFAGCRALRCRLRPARSQSSPSFLARSTGKVGGRPGVRTGCDGLCQRPISCRCPQALWQWPPPFRSGQQGREFIFDRIYHRLEARLAPVAKPQAASIPRFDPASLYGTAPFVRAGQVDGQQDANFRTIDLFGGTLPIEDGQELEAREIMESLAEILAASQQAGLEPAVPEGPLWDALQQTASEPAPPNTSILAKSAFQAGDGSDRSIDLEFSSLYASVYQTAQALSIPPELIQQVLKAHAFTTDFSQSVRAGDGFQFLFDAKVGSSGELGELLASAMVSSAGTQRFYRFRAADGTVDYYDEQGRNSRKFLMRQPVRCSAARLASGFGSRLHPLLQIVRLHTGIDWACPEGTPVMAAGAGWV